MDILKSLLFPESRLSISYEPEKRVNRTAESVIIEGTRNGFLSLSNYLLFAANQLEDDVELSTLSYVSSQIVFRIAINDSALFADGYPAVRKMENSVYIWNMPETKLYEIVGGLHSLGYVNSEIHFDRGVDVKGISVYCVVG